MLAEKILISSSAPQQLLFREGKALQHLSGTVAPNFVELKTENGSIKLTMELVEGQTLNEWLNKTSLSSEECVQLCKQLVLTVNHLHNLGVAHLDLAPTNIMKSNRGEYGLVLLDFAHCAFAEELPFIRPRSSFAGHLSYAAPEQLGLGTDKITVKTDLYALALIIREMFGYRDHITRTYEASIAFRRSEPDLSKLPPDWRQNVTRLLKFVPEERIRILTHSDYRI